MARVLLLLRGINVGGNKKVPMADLRSLATDLGFEDVATYINSGNLVATTKLSAAAAASALEAALAKRFGFSVDVIARTAAEWKKHLAANPFLDACGEEANRVLLLASKAPLVRGAVPALRERATTERIEAAGGALWIHYPDGQGRSKLAPGLVDRLAGSATTARNWRTALVLRDMLG